MTTQSSGAWLRNTLAAAASKPQSATQPGEEPVQWTADGPYRDCGYAPDKTGFPDKLVPVPACTVIEFGDAFDDSGADFRRWCSEVGFQRFEVMHLAGPSSAAIAYK